MLIDADNAQASVVFELLAEISRYGIATVKRAYGDWTTPYLKSWKEVLHKLAIQPVQQFSYTTGKNSTDSALIIEAMDLLHAGHLDGFCIISSDSDYTRLATRIREAGLVVYGFGEKKTPEAFVAACDKFVYTEILKQSQLSPAQQEASTTGPLESSGSPALIQTDLKTMLDAAISAVAGEDGWAPLSAVGHMLLKTSPSFDPRNYGCQKLGELIRKQSFIEIKEVAGGGSSTVVHLYVRIKQQAPAV